MLSKYKAPACVPCCFSHIWLFPTMWTDVLIALLTSGKFKDKSCHLLLNLFVESSKLRYLLIPKGKSRHLWLIVYINLFQFSSVQFSSVAQSCLTLRNPMNRSTPGLPVHHKLPEFTQTHVHRVSDAIQPSHPLSSPSLPAPNPSQHQSLFQWVSSSHEVAKVLELQL